jgi:DNA-directed RNA polymerase subunit RPC12/RpoP
MDLPFEYNCSRCKTILTIKLSEIKTKRSHQCYSCGFMHNIAPEDIDKAIKEIKKLENNLKNQE